MKAILERTAFSQRLLDTLREAQIEPTPAALAREFNRRYHGKPVSFYAARKWLMGEAIPTQDKLQLLAQWLGVSAEWLRFGEPGETMGVGQKTACYRVDDLGISNDIALLNDAHKHAVRGLVDALLKAERDDQDD